MSSRLNISCPLCFEEYGLGGYHIPVVLVCGHAMCGGCACSVFREFPSNCPFCLTPSPSFSVNFSLLSLLRTQDSVFRLREIRQQQAQETFSCNLCEEPCSFLCGVCPFGQRQLCGSCSERIHSFKKYSSHSPIPLSDPSDLLPLRDALKEDPNSGPSSPRPKSILPEYFSLSPSSHSFFPALLTKYESDSSPLTLTPSTTFTPTNSVSKKANVVLQFLNANHPGAFALASHEALNDPDCCALMAMCLFDGHGTPANVPQARYFAKIAAEGGSRFGQGIRLYLERKYKEALPLILPYADDGMSVAQRCCSKCYSSPGPHQSDNENFKYARMSALQGYSVGLVNLGFCYDMGEFVTQSYEIATAFYQMAAERLDPLGQTNLAACYTNGEGVNQDFKVAFQYYVFSSNQRHPHGLSNLGDCFSKGEGVPVNHKQSFLCFQQSAKQGDAFGLNGLGTCYINGFGVPCDSHLGVYYLFMAAEQESEFGLASLGWCYEHGRGLPLDIQKAKEWYKKALAKGSDLAQARLAFLSGEGAPEDQGIEEELGQEDMEEFDEEDG